MLRSGLGPNYELQIKIAASSDIEIEGILEEFYDIFYNGRK